MKQQYCRVTIFSLFLLLSLLTLVLYLPTAKYSFINYDDPTYILENSNVTSGLNFNNIIWAFKSGYGGNWHPLTWISHMIDCKLYGLNAGGHHMTNVAFHIAASALLFLFLIQMTGAVWRSFFVASLCVASAPCRICRMDF